MITKLFFSITFNLGHDFQSLLNSSYYQHWNCRTSIALFVKLFSFSILFSVFKIKTLPNNLEHKTLKNYFWLVRQVRTLLQNKNKKYLKKALGILLLIIKSIPSCRSHTFMVFISTSRKNKIQYSITKLIYKDNMLKIFKKKKQKRLTLIN